MKSQRKANTNRWPLALLCALGVAGLLFFVNQSYAAHDPYPPPSELYHPLGSAAVCEANDPGLFPFAYCVEYEEDDCHDPYVCGEAGPLIPMTQPGIHVGLLFNSDNWDADPKMLFYLRQSDMRVSDLVDNECIEHLITCEAGFPDPGDPPLDSCAGFSSWPINAAEWDASLPDFNEDDSNFFKDRDKPNIAEGTTDYGLNRCMRSSFKALAYGGYRIRTGLTQSVASRIKLYSEREVSTLWDTGHPDAFANAGKYDVALLNEDDAALNIDSFSDAGYSKGLRYNLYCPGHAMDANGRMIAQGGHNRNSQSGFRKHNIYDPVTESWNPDRNVDIPEPCMRANWELDPYGVSKGYPPANEMDVNPTTNLDVWTTGPILNSLGNCSPRERQSNDPDHEGDDRYQRWYPTSVAMPGDLIITIGGTDEDERVGPNTNVTNVSARDAAVNNTTVHSAIVGVYDVEADRSTPLENARMRFPLYPQPVVVQQERNGEEGLQDDDWVMCVLGGLIADASEASLPRDADTHPAGEWTPFCPQAPPAAKAACEDNVDPPSIAGLGDGPLARIGDGRGLVGGVNEVPFTGRAVRWNGRYPGPLDGDPDGGGEGASLDCLDVLSALDDDDLNIPAHSTAPADPAGVETAFWTHVDSAKHSHDYCCPDADLVEIDKDGNTVSHEWYIFGGKPADLNQSSRDIEGITFTDATPEWELQRDRTHDMGPIACVIDADCEAAVNFLSTCVGGLCTLGATGTMYQTNSSADGVVLPDGQVLILGGSQRAHVHAGELEVPEGLEEQYNLKNQMFDPATGRVTTLAKTHTRRGLHGAALLFGDGRVFHMGDNRTSVVPQGDRVFSPGDGDLGISNGYFFSPPYLFNPDGSPADRPVIDIDDAPNYIDYDDDFEISVSHESGECVTPDIRDVVLIRNDMVTHALNTGNRYVKLWFEADDDSDSDSDSDCDDGVELQVNAPQFPAQAIAGDHWLFVVDSAGVPSRAKHVRLRAPDRGDDSDDDSDSDEDSDD